MPLDRARLWLQRQDRRGIEVVARAEARIPRGRVAGAPVDGVQLGILGSGQPGRAAAALPRVAAIFPGLGPRLARRGHGIGAP